MLHLTRDKNFDQQINLPLAVRKQISVEYTPTYWETSYLKSPYIALGK